MKKPLAIYVHVPFCASKCAYCDFASFPKRESDWDRFFTELGAEIDAWRGETDFGRLDGRYRVRSLFIGGGTPTLVPDRYICGIVDRCRSLAPFDADAEITVEGNPGTLTPEKLAAYRTHGVNRLSLGAQSFDPALLRRLGRIHTVDEIGEAVRMARAAGFDNINLDLMYALPGQTMGQWLDTLDRAVELGVEHLSAYSLIVEPGTPMAGWVGRGEVALPDEDAVIDMQRAAIERLAKAGYARYEISNYARPGRESRHNMAYWLRGDYLGLGCAAHSMLDDCRFSNPETLDGYLSGARRIGFERLDESGIAEETLMLATRTVRGLDLSQWRSRFSADFAAGREGTLDRLARGGLVEIDGGFLRLTRAGMEVQDAVVLALLTDD